MQKKKQQTKHTESRKVGASTPDLWMQKQRGEKKRERERKNPKSWCYNTGVFLHPETNVLKEWMEQVSQ
jgi:hypothetical protein